MKMKKKLKCVSNITDTFLMTFYGLLRMINGIFTRHLRSKIDLFSLFYLLGCAIGSDKGTFQIYR